MKISRDARKRAKKLYRFCLQEDRLDENRMHQVISQLAIEKPRDYLGIMARLKKLVEIEVKSQTIQVGSAQELPDRGAGIERAASKIVEGVAAGPEIDIAGDRAGIVDDNVAGAGASLDRSPGRCRNGAAVRQHIIEGAGEKNAVAATDGYVA